MLNDRNTSPKRMIASNHMDLENEVALSLLELGHMNTVSPSHDSNQGDDSFSVKDNGLCEKDFLTLAPSSIFEKIQNEISKHVDLCSKISQIESCSNVHIIYDSMYAKMIVDSAIQCLLLDKGHTLDLIRKRGNEMLSRARERERFRDMIGVPVQFSPQKFSSEGLSGITSFMADNDFEKCMNFR